MCLRWWGWLDLVVWVAIVTMILVGFGCMSGHYVVFVAVVLVVRCVVFADFQFSTPDDVTEGLTSFDLIFFVNNEGQRVLTVCFVHDFAVRNCRKPMGILCERRRIAGICNDPVPLDPSTRCNKLAPILAQTAEPIGDG